jgi:hypothetical protein
MVTEYAPSVGGGCTTKVRNVRRSQQMRSNRMPTTLRGIRRLTRLDAETAVQRRDSWGAKVRKVA